MIHDHKKDASQWSAPNATGVAPKATTLVSEEGEEALVVSRPFEQNGTPELKRLYRTIIHISRKGPLPRELSKIFVKLMQELLARGEIL